MNAPTVITAVLVAVLFFAIVAGAIRGRKKNGGCCGGCQSCPGRDFCHGSTQARTDEDDKRDGEQP